MPLFLLPLPLCRPVTQISAPVVLSSVTILKDASTLIGGGADGMCHLLNIPGIQYKILIPVGNKLNVLLRVINIAL